MSDVRGGKYYEKFLSAERLRRCYEIAPPRVRQYLRAETAHAAKSISPGDRVLELGCGYGRVLNELLPCAAALLVGIDTSSSSLELAGRLLGNQPHCHLARMDAGRLGFRKRAFDLVIGIQNGVSAFGVDPSTLIAEAVRVTRRGGRVLFSSYAAEFWDDRLAWFDLQAQEGLLGPIHHEATGDGVIVCKDGFRAKTIAPDEFRRLATPHGCSVSVHTVDESSVFCEITV